ncbi:coatomer gamma subunit Sec21 [Protomyces lactucae-debilis]|uniref:Coatomer subunit gamma n=1 Tax=Protomyces lactucae-debilis TaxID=2754530 RepID=A0A1Y2EZE2_PROLT|nr:coatomer gamma subunit Sec21 [Protomyces lactucae-debilis]ORY76634.1 coatomer gamma subunit Sec21 [Protomyces lactucae-debilis]
MSDSKKDEDGSSDFFANIDRTTVFQGARLFNQSPISPKKCRILLTKLIYLLSTGEKFSTQESTDLFFGMTKLFQHKDASLRQMVYVVMQELYKDAEDTIMITSSIMKDTSTSSETMYRPNSIRALTRIIDGGSIPVIERPISTAIVDKTPAVSSAALVSSIHLFPLSKDIVRRWMNQVSEVLTSRTVGATIPIPAHLTQLNLRPNPSFMCQYHALGLLYLMRGHDRMGVVKMIQTYSKPAQSGGSFFGGKTPDLRSSWAVCLLVRYARQVIDEDVNFRAPMFALLDGWLKHKSDMVNLEAAKAILTLPTLTSSEAQPALNTLQIFLTSPRFVTRFAAIRILNRFSQRMPQAMASLNVDIEPLVSDTNRNIATYAITTLLKTGSEESVERLMETIQGFMADISDEFKIIVISSIRALCLKFPSKQASTLTFLAEMLRDDGGYDFKKALVEAIFDLIKYVDDAKEEALAQLCEFIEDCEYHKLSARILYVVGREGPRCKEPNKFVRYIYNRIILENAIVRAAAVNALARFAQVPALNHSVRVLLKRCLGDSDDEVRDRAALALRVLESDKQTEKYLQSESTYNLPQLEKSLVLYVQEANYGAQFKIEEVQVISRADADAAALASKTDISSGEEILPTPTMETTVEVPSPTAEKFAESLSAISEFKAFGDVLRSGPAIALTTPEMEFHVQAHVHLYAAHVVLQFNIQNTLTDTILEKVGVMATPSEEDFVEEFILEAEKATATQNATVYAVFSRPAGTFAVCDFSNVLKYTSRELDPSTGEAEEEGYDDEYEVDTLELGASAYIQPLYVSNFQTTFDGLPESCAEVYALSELNSLEEACERIVKALGMTPLEGSDVPMSGNTHTLKVAGKVIGKDRESGTPALATIQLAFRPGKGVSLKITAKSEKLAVAELVAGGIA